MAKLAEDFPHGAQLTDAGFGTTSKVQKASDEEILAIEGIGPAGLEKIRAASIEPEEAVTEDAATEDGEAQETELHKCSNPTCGYEIAVSPCPYCGTV